jgi:hypothetical protein
MLAATTFVSTLIVKVINPRSRLYRRDRRNTVRLYECPTIRMSRGHWRLHDGMWEPLSLGLHKTPKKGDDLSLLIRRHRNRLRLRASRDSRHACTTRFAQIPAAWGVLRFPLPAPHRRAPLDSMDASVLCSFSSVKLGPKWRDTQLALPQNNCSPACSRA